MKRMISIPDNKIDVINHLESQCNKSGYLVKLIEKDMQNEIITKDMIIDLIKQHAGEGGVSANLLSSLDDIIG
jgi:hypothetical protein